MQPSPWDFTWDVDPDRHERFPAHISVTTVNAPGSLAEIAATPDKLGAWSVLPV